MRPLRIDFGSSAGLSSSRASGAKDTRYLIPGILAAGQPGGIYGGLKTLKTSLAADLLISLASGTPFLGRFPVAEPGRVVFLSGEAGLEALQASAAAFVRNEACRWSRSTILIFRPICRGSIGRST